MRRLNRWCLVALAGILVAGCKTSPPPLPGGGQKSNLTPGMVKSTLVQGQTLQAQVLNTFGAPQIVTRDQSGHEVWTYDVQSVSHASAQTQRSGGGGVAAAALAGEVPLAGGAGGQGSRATSAGQVSSTTFTLMITFDENDVVQDYRMMSTQF